MLRTVLKTYTLRRRDGDQQRRAVIISFPQGLGLGDYKKSRDKLARMLADGHHAFLFQVSDTQPLSALMLKLIIAFVNSLGSRAGLILSEEQQQTLRVLRLDQYLVMGSTLGTVLKVLEQTPGRKSRA